MYEEARVATETIIMFVARKMNVRLCGVECPVETNKKSFYQRN